ncbi:MAG TPA: spore coat U domain-containing protein [Thermoanaerobaculia bacterium]
MKNLKIAVIAALLLSASQLEAGSCTWRTNPTNVVFGIYSVFGTGSLSATSSYEFRCTPNTEGIMTFSRGSNAGSYFPRYMASGGNLIGYNVYDDAANTVVIGDGSGGTTRRVVFNGTPQNKDFSDTVYASVPLGTDVPPGTYVDTITATLSWDNFARSSSVTFTVTTIVQAECTVTTAPVAFGDYDPVAANVATPLDQTGSINVYCTPGTVATVSLGNGLNFVGGTRRMAGPAGSFLNYQLYRNAARTLLWSIAPNTVSGTSTSHLTPINGGLTVYGRVPAGQDPVYGQHGDTVQATVNY